MKREVMHKVVMVTLLAFPSLAMAGVNPENGGFFITYSDITLQSGDHELKLNRTYNSLASEIGWFGYGWGSRYETRLVVLPDGSAAIKENGAGRTTYYRAGTASAVKAGIQRIVETATKRDNLTPDAAGKLSTQLNDNEELRLRKVIQYGITTDLTKGAALGDECGEASLTRVADGYRRVDCNRFGDAEPATDTFDLRGRLVRHELNDGYAVTIRYAEAGMAEIRDTQGQSIALTWTPEGRVSSAKANETEMTYVYDVKQNLQKATTTNGLSYRYSYDANHNLTRITYIDDTSMSISYSPKVIGRVATVTQRNGDQQSFVFPDESNKQSSIESEREHNPTGTEQPQRIEGRNRKETTFDQKGRVIRQKNDAGKISEYTYDPQSDKLVTVINDGQKTEFKYDGHGNLIRAENSTGQVIDLEYSNTKLIQRIVEVNRTDKTRRELAFKYNKDGRPTEITLVGTGKILVEYDGNGEINHVGSSEGTTMALQVTEAFQNLLSVVKVAGARF